MMRNLGTFTVQRSESSIPITCLRYWKGSNFKMSDFFFLKWKLLMIWSRIAFSTVSAPHEICFSFLSFCRRFFIYMYFLCFFVYNLFTEMSSVCRYWNLIWPDYKSSLCYLLSPASNVHFANFKTLLQYFWPAPYKSMMKDLTLPSSIYNIFACWVQVNWKLRYILS